MTTAQKTRVDWSAERRRFVSLARAPRLRTMREFAEQEFVLPDGPYSGLRFRVDRQPYVGHWLDAIDSGKWTRFAACGPTQTGKTFSCFLVPLFYHLFEIGENVVCGVPDMAMANDKWKEDILPVLDKMSYRKFMPTKGDGSRGGRVKEAVRFKNGATLRFMTGGSSDQGRAAFTARVLVVTEVDGMDYSVETSREADKVSQLEGRVKAFGDLARTYLESTATIKEGRIWREYILGTESKLAIRCPHCKRHVSPERESLVGWRDAPDEMSAAESSAYFCPNCGQEWSEEDRRLANIDSLLIHRGQEVASDGQIVGEAPRTYTLGFRWNAVNNLFRSAANVGREEWRAARDTNEDNAERKMRQQTWAMPYEPASFQTTPLDAQALASRVNNFRRGLIPGSAKWLTIGLDLGKYLCHWSATAWGDHATGWLIDYGRLEIATNELGFERALMAALRDFRETCKAGWPQGDVMLQPAQVWIDLGWAESQDTVFAFCSECLQSGGQTMFMGSLGRGAGQEVRTGYRQPKSTGNVVKFVGDRYDITHYPEQNALVANVDANHWKSWLHERLSCPQNEPGAMTFFQAPQREHFTFAKHLTAEREVQEFKAGKGMIRFWERVSQNNHWFDSTYNACAAGHLCGVRVVSAEVEITEPKPAVVSAGKQREARW